MATKRKQRTRKANSPILYVLLSFAAGVAAGIELVGK